MSRIILIVIIFSINAAGCATLPPKDYTDFNAADIRSILVVPVVYNSVDVTAPDYFLSTVSIPVAEHGYYVFPVNLIKRTMEDDGLSDANLEAPYKFIGAAALSVLSAITFCTDEDKHASIIFCAPITFVFIVSNGLYSDMCTCLRAAA